MMSKMGLWEKARATDPSFTKPFSRGGGFSGIATNATYMIRRATETFGPVGIGWGWVITDERYVTGGPIADGVNAIIHVCRIRLWYIHEEKRGEYEHIGETIFVGKNKNGIFTDEDAPKKSLTDAITKALSCIGFSADIHLGLWDDNKYVAQVRAEFSAAGNGKDNPKEPSDMDIIDAIISTFEQKKTFAELAALVKTESDKMAHKCNSDGRARLIKAASEIATRKFPAEYAASKTPAKGNANVDPATN